MIPTPDKKGIELYPSQSAHWYHKWRVAHQMHAHGRREKPLARNSEQPDITTLAHFAVADMDQVHVCHTVAPLSHDWQIASCEGHLMFVWHSVAGVLRADKQPLEIIGIYLTGH